MIQMRHDETLSFYCDFQCGTEFEVVRKKHEIWWVAYCPKCNRLNRPYKAVPYFTEYELEAQF